MTVQIESSREKWWKEVTDAERIQRLRQVVKSQAITLNRMERELDRLLGHSHSEGRVVAPIQGQGIGTGYIGGSISGDPDEVWL